MSKSPLVSRSFNLSSLYAYQPATCEVVAIKHTPTVNVDANRPLSAILARITPR